MKTCPNCGNQVTDEALFCNNCGTSMTGVASNPVQETPVVEETVATAQEAVASAEESVTNAAQALDQAATEAIDSQTTPVFGSQPQNNPFAGQQGIFPDQAQNFAGPQFGGPQQGMPQPQPVVSQQSYQIPYIDPSDHTKEFDPRDIADNKLFAVLPYFTSILGIIAALMIRESAYTRFHVKNVIRLHICLILCCIPSIIPIVGWIVTAIGFAVIGVLSIIGIVNVFQGKAKDLPIISNIGFLK